MGIFGHVARLDSGFHARDALRCTYARHTEIRSPSAGEDQPHVQGRLICTRMVMAPQPPSAKNGTLQSDVDIPGERDRRYGRPPPKCSDDDDDNDDERYLPLYPASTNV